MFCEEKVVLILIRGDGSAGEDFVREEVRRGWKVEGLYIFFVC